MKQWKYQFNWTRKWHQINFILWPSQLNFKPLDFISYNRSELELLLEGYEVINDFVTAGIVQYLKSLLGESDHW